jgi:hypothetical protein
VVEEGALIIVDETKSRVRILPLKGHEQKRPPAWRPLLHGLLAQFDLQGESVREAAGASLRSCVCAVGPERRPGLAFS